MEAADQQTRVSRKSLLSTSYSSVADSNGRTRTVTKQSTSSSYRVAREGVPLDEANVDDESKLRSRGIEIADHDGPRYEKLSPEQMADYYKSLGDWQNVLPKTDYSYSPVSRFYKKKINGVIPVIPNMSRRDIHLSPEVLDNEVNLFYAKNYLYEEEYSNQNTAAAGATADIASRLSPSRSYGGFTSSGLDAFQSTPTKTRSSLRLARLKSSFGSGDSREFAVGTAIPSCKSDYYSIGSSATRLITRLVTLPITVFNVVYSSLTRHTYTNVSHRSVVKQSTMVSAEATRTTPRTTTSSTLWRLLLFALLILLLGAGFVRVRGDSSVDAITLPVSKSYSLVTHLVCGLYEITYSSVAFTLSMISVAGANLHESASSIQLTTLYQLVTVPTWKLWGSSSSNRTESNSATPSLSNDDIEELFKRWLAAVGTDELAKKIMASDEFVRFIDEKLKRVEREGSDRLEELAVATAAAAQKPLMLERRVQELQTKVAQLETMEVTLRQSFEQKLAALRADIGEREQRLEKEVIVALAAVLGIGGEVSAEELKSRFAALFHSVEGAWSKIRQMDEQFAKFARNSSDSVDAQLERTSRDLKHELRLSVEEMVAKKLSEWKRSAAVSGDSGHSGCENGCGTIDPAQADQLEAYVKGVVRKALEVYDADKTGLADYALESSGGIVLSTRCTETKPTNAQFTVFGIPLWQSSRSPRTVIQPDVHPGECWAFPGSNGYLVIQLSERIFVTGVTLEHIPRALAPNGTIDSAPKDFSVWTLRWESDPEPKLLGKFRFEVDGPSLQYFATNRLPEPYQIVELKILSNHGKIDYTCLYRFRVHGVPG